MKQAIHEQDALARHWKHLYAPIAAELAAAEELLKGELSSDDPFVDNLVKHAFRLGGKRLRRRWCCFRPRRPAKSAAITSCWLPWSR